MADHHREGAPPAFEEDRHEHEDIGQMHAAMIGVVHDDDVAVVQIALEFRQHRGHGFRDRAEMLGDGLGLRHHLAVAGAKGRGKIHHVLDDLGARDPHHRIGHVVGDRIEPALDDGKGDRIDLHGVELQDDAADRVLVHRGIGRHHDGGVELLDDQRALSSRVSDGAAVDDLDCYCGLAAGKGNLARPFRDVPARGAIFIWPKSSRLSRRPRPATRSFINSIGVSSR